LNQLCIRRWKSERRELVACHPPHLLTELRRRRAADVAAQEVQLDVPIRIGVRGREHLASDRGLHPELLANFAHQAGGVCLARLALPSGKLPVPLEMNAALTARQQEAIVALDDRGGNNDRDHCLSGLNGNARQLFAIGHTRHLTLRAMYSHTKRSAAAVFLFCLAALVPIGLLLSGALSTADAGARITALAVAAVMAISAFAFSSLTVMVRDGQLSWWFGPGLVKKTVPLSTIVSAGPTTTSILNGWGIHFTGRAPVVGAVSVRGSLAMPALVGALRLQRGSEVPGIGLSDHERIGRVLPRFSGCGAQEWVAGDFAFEFA